MKRDSVPHTIAVTMAVAIVCSLLVSSAAVGLRSLQESNKARSQKMNILKAAGLLDESGSIEAIFDENVQTRLVDLTTGDFVDATPSEISDYDQKSAARDPDASGAIDPDADLAGIRRRENLSLVYLIEDGGQMDQIVLPFRGKGLFSTLYGFLAVGSDRSTIRGITFYEHGETPGLGGEVDNSKWTGKWIGKKIFDEEGDVAIGLIKGVVLPDQPDAKFAVDGLSGATMTSKGVTGMLHFWLGPDGFGPFLKRTDF